MNNQANHSSSTAGERLMRKPEVLARIGLGNTTLYANIKAGTFPAPVSLGGRAVAWRQTEIDGWIADRIAASRGQLGEHRRAERQ
ncbi:AlpA family transcriptional regulator [Rhizobacter sp. Root16D2]|uniref:helix-turn-helix transcriptional regulator n=1 Tax=Rhizobacter sp. Root16D2 TaxID=1736479 RepID=UPI0006F40551|nr:AlpA family transcriptional regulator [Rhizobacter sp. Root16D2]KRB20414.1 hypothetical protein ASE08_22475 [Rhizobacter sp. Root16D2]